MDLLRFMKAVIAGAALFLVSAAPVATAQQPTPIRMHTGSPGSSPFVFFTTMQTVLQRNLPVRINLTSGMTPTRSTLDASRGQVDFFLSAPAINGYMESGTAMFAKMANAPELFKNVRSVLNFPLGPYHIITYADSGITDLKQIKDKRVFLGPPGGAATAFSMGIVEGATGYKSDTDYEMVKLDWPSGIQALQDRQVDLAIIPTELRSALIQQIALLGKIRLLGIDEKAVQSEPMQRVLALPGRTIEVIPADAYGANQVNTEPVRTAGSWVGVGTHVQVDEELVYQITKTIFENIEQFHRAAEFMKNITVEGALRQMNAPLHTGALRYYREVGIEVPESLIPPEAK